jgi:type I restriction enzyme, S subunit
MVPYLRAANVTWRGFDLTDVKRMDFRPSEQEIYRLRPGDVLLSEASGSPTGVGKPAVWHDEIPGCCFQNTLLRVRPRAEMSKYLYYHFLHDALVGRFAEGSKGVGINHLGAERLSAWPVRVAPISEQGRIVAAIEEQFTRLDAAMAGLKRVRANLKRYRAAVLKAACEGRLVPTEAELARAEGRDYEPADRLLARILEERRAQWEAEQLAKLRAAGKAPKGDGWKAKYQEPDGPLVSDLPGLPDGWVWSSLRTIAELKGGLTMGQRRRPSDAVRAVPYLRVANVQRGFLDLREVKQIDATETEIDELRLQPGDILFTAVLVSAEPRASSHNARTSRRCRRR